MYTLDNYRSMIGYYYYYNETPIGIITDIQKNYNGSYSIKFEPIYVFLKQTPIDNVVTLDKECMALLYEQYLIRLERSNFLNMKGVNYITHFTKIENLESILQNGILSKNILTSLGIIYNQSDNLRLDNKLDFICNSISFPNYKMFYAKRMEDSSQKWVVLEIDKSIIMHKLTTEFYNANSSSSYYDKFRCYNCNEALFNMFHINNRDISLPSNYPTDPQAEVLVKDSISTPYISYINLNYDDEKVKKLTKEFNIECRYNKHLFDARVDYERWK